MINDQNQQTYTDPSIVSYYAQLRTLQPAERTILTLLQERLSNMKMLDLGVGAGRTTQYFAPLVAAYTGLDYSAEMIAHCRQKFPNLSWQVGDARNLEQLENNSFDFILFSFNGIDYISHTDRSLVLQEVNRLGKSGGYFGFSSHNLQGIESEFNWRKKISLNPFSSYVNLLMWAILRACNRGLTYDKILTYDYAIIRDEPHNFRLQTYYARPKEQLKQLESYFRDIKIYSWQTGQEIQSESELNSNLDQWLYYLCVIR
jgi:ubiquinone/menaquinone biosynthesis C-methylase UbiE